MSLNTSAGTLGENTPSLGNFPANHEFYVKDFIEIANPILLFDMFGTPKDIPANSSNTIKFNKVLKLSTLEDSPLSEGVTPVEQQARMIRLSKSIDQYGAFMTTTDRLQGESINGLTAEFNKISAEQAAETMNKVVRDDLYGSTNIRYAGGVANRNAITSSTMPFADFNFMFQAFKLEHVKVPKNRVATGGSEKVGTLPQRRQYPCLFPVESQGLIEALDDGLGATYVSAERYMTQKALWPDEEGSFKHFAFLTNTEVDVVTNAAGTPQDIALGLVFGDKAFHTTKVGAGDVQIFIKALGSGGTSDPIDQRSTIGWKATKGAIIVQPTYMWQYEFSIGAAA